MKKQDQKQGELYEQPNNISISDFGRTVLFTINTLKTTGKSYRRKIHTYDMIYKIYLEAMLIKIANLGEKYQGQLSEYVEYIFQNISETSPYDAFQFLHDVIKWYFSKLAFKYNLTKKEPSLPDYMIAEIRDIYNNMKI